MQLQSLYFNFLRKKYIIWREIFTFNLWLYSLSPAWLENDRTIQDVFVEQLFWYQKSSRLPDIMDGIPLHWMFL